MNQAEPYHFATSTHNINLLWANLFIEELTRHGITEFCIAPGSRSTSLTLAAANHPLANTHMHFDERGLGFLALGMSQASLKPTVIITTSGTAVANLYPAVIEARQSQIPLIILSADRPPELINCGANQAIDQHALFANYPVYFQQLPSPTTSIQSSFLLTSLAQGLTQQRLTQGPIHFNMAIPEPFYPDQKQINFERYLAPLGQWLTQKVPFTTYHQPTLTSMSPQPYDLQAQRILIVVGRMKDQQQAQSIVQACHQQQAILFADVQSQLQGEAANLAGYDLLLANEHFADLIAQADLVIQFSDHLVSKRLNTLLSHLTAPVCVVSEHTHLIDPAHCVKQRIISTPSAFINTWINSQPIDSDWLQAVNQYRRPLQTFIAPYISDPALSEINTCHHLLNEYTHPLVLGNSLAIRLADMFGRSSANIYTHRGASGIDGLIAGAIGIAKQNHQATTLLLGDTSFLYDINALALLTQLDHPFIIVLLNNDGGGIFNLLPVPEQQQRTFYQNPHGLTFQKTAEQFAMNYQQPTTLSEFQAVYQQALYHQNQHQCTLIEVCINNQVTPTQLFNINSEVKNAVIL